MRQFYFKTAEETQQQGQEFARELKISDIIFLEGPLGAGKTTWIRGLLCGLGYAGPVKSPTFTLLETYELTHATLIHADLYRLNHAPELEAIGFRDYVTAQNIIVIEWASKAKNVLPKPTVECQFVIPEDGTGRQFIIRNII